MFLYQKTKIWGNVMKFDFYPFLRFISKTTYYIDRPVVARDCRILYIISGYGSFESNGKTIDLNPNTLVFYPYGKVYQIKSEANSEPLLFYTLNFDFSQDYIGVRTMLPQIANKQECQNVLYSIPEELCPVFSNIISFNNAIWAEKYIEYIHTESLNQNSGYSQICDSYLKIFLISIYRKVTNESFNNPICDKIKDLIHKNLQINIKELAANLNYHPFYLNDVFKKCQGTTLHKYLVKQRLIKANELITTTQMQLADIAFICGFSSQSHLSSAFKKEYHTTPKNMRRQF